MTVFDNTIPFFRGKKSLKKFCVKKKITGGSLFEEGRGEGCKVNRWFTF